MATPEIVSIGEPMVEFNALDRGALRHSSAFEFGWGGDASNFAVAASRLGAASAIVTRLGDDDFGHSLLELWEREGVDSSAVRVADGEFTAAYFVTHSERGHEFSYLRSGSAASRLTTADLPLDLITGARALHATGITQAISQSACDAAFAALVAAREAGVLTTYDPNLRLKLWPLERARATILHALSLVDVALPSLDDAVQLTGHTDPEVIVREIHSRGPSIVALKLGGDGAIVSDGRKTHRVGAMPIDLVDASGAGDTFDAAFVVAYLEGRPLEDCARFANAAAALTASGVGCVGPIPRRDEVEALIIRQATSG